MINVWHDCDPGHDDALALMYCLDNPKINLVGVSTVHGNQLAWKTYINALRVLYITGNVDKIKSIPVLSGANKPLKRESRICPEIHGKTGLGGVDWDEVDKKLESLGLDLDLGKKQNIEDVVEGIHNAFLKYGKLTILVTGCHTNIANYVLKYPDDIKTGNINLVAMGGSINVFGNTGPWQEFNIQIDPEAFSIVLKAFQVKDKGPLVSLIPLDVTHHVLCTPEVVSKLDENNKFEKIITQLLLFFKDTYKTVFYFDSPPVHDPVAAFYIVHPEEFEVQKVKAVIETEGKYTSGAICIKRYEKVQPYCEEEEFSEMNVCLKVNVDKYWECLINHLHELAKKSPL